MNDEMRKEFEKQMRVLGFCEHNDGDFDLNQETGEYLFQDLNSMKVGFIIGWQASREAMKPIKLPVVNLKMPMDYRIGFSRAVYDCEDAIQQAGYKVEE